MTQELMYQRDVYGKTLAELGRSDESIVVFDADLSGSTRTSFFAREFPARFFNFGVAEQNMMAAASGMASCGKKVFASTFAMFASGRAWDQVRNSICYSNMNVKIVATHAGVTVGPDGATHQALEDICIMRVIPNMTVVVPCDGPQTRAAITAAAATNGPMYIRLGRSKFPTIEGSADFQIGKAQILRTGNEAAIVACGIMVNAALSAAQILAGEGINVYVVNMHTIKPIDSDAINEIAGKVGAFVVCEEHSTFGGLGSAVEEVLAASDNPQKVARVGVKNRFGQSGDPEALLREYHLMPEDIAAACRKVLKRD